MNDKPYVIDGDQHLAELADQSVAEMEAMYWRLDEEGALLYPDEYAGLRRELDYYLGQPSSALEDHEFRRLALLRAFFAAHPNPPPAPLGYVPLP